MSGLQLVLGSLERADEYQRVLLSLKADGKDVQGEMVDRILDGGEYLSDISSRRRQMKERQGR
jgi:hypothetical protein